MCQKALYSLWSNLLPINPPRKFAHEVSKIFLHLTSSIFKIFVKVFGSISNIPNYLQLNDIRANIDHSFVAIPIKVI